MSLLREKAPGIVLLRGALEGEVLDILAPAVARAVIGARGTCTRLALVSGEAITLAGLAIADATVGTFGVLVVVAQLVGSVHPRKLKGAYTLGAITGVKAQTHAPVVPAVAHAILQARPVARTSIIAPAGRSHGQKN
jgi:hypothetical protein